MSLSSDIVTCLLSFLKGNLLTKTKQKINYIKETNLDKNNSIFLRKKKTEDELIVFLHL